jgi:hypothetical protein
MLCPYIFSATPSVSTVGSVHSMDGVFSSAGCRLEVYTMEEEMD